ncbi:gallate dioxygenase [Sphingomonas sp. 10B4]|uniref:gallate dioxygenase n=1 Tax=Sphingomonas sp. 10B4 TaxID=3048575 RepID=UPI002AB5B2E2|nr:gallate dioxygenase [Sphingomonas sp. 10B4]MDY7522844.1 gallate dioxygenase [Sphingomonas sp. 10B4]MEB0284379.1 gallate dioxygenase [Sphingomonas sp. 10B4]
MARIIGGIGTSHTPTIGFALDAGKQGDPAWAPIFAAYAPLKAWLDEKKPDVAFVIFNDHVTSFFFDHYSAFALGVGAEFEVADEGGGPRTLPTIAGHPALARHIAEQLVADEFDMSLFQRRPLDHGCFSPLSLLYDHAEGWPVAMIPLAVGVLQNPVPTARRCWKLGQALRRAIESYPEDLSVAIIATGGLSHQVHGARAGFNDPVWDHQFLDLIVNDPETLAQMSQAELAMRGGWESSEVVMWLVMRGALAARPEVLSRNYYLPSMTGIATLLLENRASVAGLKPMAQLDTATLSLPASQPFTLDVSVANYDLNRFLQKMVEPRHREAFLADEEGALAASGLASGDQNLIRRRDWTGLIERGAIFFGLEKLAAVLGLPNATVYAGMRGETLAEFQASRNAPGALYSVGSSLKQDRPAE